MKHALLILAALAAAGLLSADTIVLSNGDRVTGQVVNTADGKITVKTEFMGDVSIDQKAIQSIRTEEPLTVTFESGEKIVGEISTEGEQIRVVPENQPPVTKPLSALAAVRDADSQRAFEREVERTTDPGWLDFWALTANLALATAQGNAQTSTLTSGLELVRRTGFDKTLLGFSQIYSTQSTTEPTGATANRVSGRARYERDISKSLFAYGNANFDFDEFQDLDLRSVLGGGLGWHIIRNDAHTLDFSAGGNWNREKFSTGLVRDAGEVAIGEESTHKLNNRWKVFQAFTLYPNLSETGEYRFNFDAGSDFKLSNLISWAVTLSNRFLSNPLEGNKKNDILFSTGIQFNWAQ